MVNNNHFLQLHVLIRESESMISKDKISMVYSNLGDDTLHNIIPKELHYHFQKKTMEEFDIDHLKEEYQNQNLEVLNNDENFVFLNNGLSIPIYQISKKKVVNNVLFFKNIANIAISTIEERNDLLSFIPFSSLNSITNIKMLLTNDELVNLTKKYNPQFLKLFFVKE